MTKRMQPIDLDFRTSDRKAQRVRLVLLALAIAFVGDLATSYHALRQQVARKEARLAAHPGQMQTVALEAAPHAVSANEIEFARDTIRRLATPWRDLFKALEAAHNSKIALLAIEPDAEASTVTVSGEAKDYLAVLNYVATLSQTDSLRAVRLAHHEIRSDNPYRPVAFTILAAWKEGNGDRRKDTRP